MFEGSQASPACPSDSSSINMKMRMEHWWNDTDRGRQNIAYWWNDTDRGRQNIAYWWNDTDRGRQNIAYWWNYTDRARQNIAYWWNDTDRRRQKYWEKKKPVPVSLYPPQIPHELTWDRIRASSVGDRPMAARTTARPPSSSVVFPLHIADVTANTQIYLQYVGPTITNMHGNHSSYTDV